MRRDAEGDAPPPPPFLLHTPPISPRLFTPFPPFTCEQVASTTDFVWPAATGGVWDKAIV